jgi:hypothetical protein
MRALFLTLIWLTATPAVAERVWRTHCRTQAQGRNVKPRSSRLSDGLVIVPNLVQPRLLLDKGEHLLKRRIRRKAAKIGRSSLGPWEKIARIQRLIWMQVQHAGNDSTDDNNPYYRFTKRAARAGVTVQLRDYLKRRKVLCFELACLTQVALEDAGLDAELVGGVLFKRGQRIGAHAWNTVKLDGTSRVVDTTNPDFNGEDSKELEGPGTRDGWRFVRDSLWPDVVSPR